MQWFDQNPYGPNATFRERNLWRSHKIGRRLFSSSYKRSGFAATAFAPTVKEAWINPWRRKLPAPPPTTPAKPGILTKIAGKWGAKVLKGVGKVGIASTLLLPAMGEEGGVEKARAVAAGVAGIGGWAVGSKVGASLGFTIGSAFGGVGAAPGALIGAILGGVGGAIGADEGFRALTKIPDNMVERERARRNLNWVGDTAAFNTEKAYTMRQQSLLAMNRGLMNSRSMLGREGVMLHQ